MDYSSFKGLFTIKEDHGDKCKAICPSHPDKEASLSIRYDRVEGKITLYCHAGCETKDIVESVGKKMSDLFDEPLQSSATGNSKIETIYKYRDEKGDVVFEKVRFKATDSKKKHFTQRRQVKDAIVWGLESGTYYETYPGSNEWSKNLGKKVNPKQREFPECEPIIYNLPIILKAIAEGHEVYIAEGEKDADNLTAIGFPCTCNFDGASASDKKQKWRKSYNQIFNNAKVIIFNDNDDPGRAHADFIAQELYDIAEYVKRPVIPGLMEKEDISDFIAAGHTKEEIMDLVEHTERWDPSLQPEDVNLIGYNFSDVGNAERLIAAYGQIIRYRPGRKNGWLIWSGKHWQVDYDGKIEVLARKVIKMLQKQGKDLPDDENEKLKKEIQRFVLKSEADNRIKAMINQAKSQTSIVLKELDRNPYLLNLKNGTLNLKTGVLQAHNRRDYISRLVNIEYNPEMQCPNWIEFVNKIFLNNTELIKYIQKSIGYSMTGDANLQCFYILHGQGSNGKGTFMKAIMTIMGDYAAVLKANSLMEKMGDEGARGDLAKLEGKYFVCVNELEEGKSFDESLVKSLTSGADEAVPVRRMYEEEFDLHPTFKMWMTTNKLPKIKGTDNGIWRRVRKIPFEYNFENDENKNPHFFEDSLLPEMSGILNWAIEGCLKWQQEGMQVPDIVQYAIEDYKNDMDAVQRFINESCIVSETCKVKRSDMYDAYCEWCKENKEYTLSSIKLNKKLAEKNFQEVKVMGIYYWKGIGLITNDHDESLIPCKNNISPFWGEN